MDELNEANRDFADSVTAHLGSALHVIKRLICKGDCLPLADALVLERRESPGAMPEMAARVEAFLARGGRGDA